MFSVVFLFGFLSDGKTIDEEVEKIEENLSMPEILQTIRSMQKAEVDKRKFLASVSWEIDLEANQLIHLMGDQPGDTNLALLDGSLIKIKLVTCSFSCISFLLKLV